MKGTITAKEMKNFQRLKNDYLTAYDLFNAYTLKNFLCK